MYSLHEGDMICINVEVKWNYQNTRSTKLLSFKAKTRELNLPGKNIPKDTKILDILNSIELSDSHNWKVNVNKKY